MARATFKWSLKRALFGISHDLLLKLNNKESAEDLLLWLEMKVKSLRTQVAYSKKNNGEVEK